MLETSARLLRVLSLLQARGFWTGRELAERLEITERTVRRDVDRLRDLGYPVNATSGVAGGYRLGAGATLPPLLLEDDEALAVALGLRSAAGGTVSGVEAAAVRALAKLEQVLPPRLHRRVKALHSSVVPMHQIGPVVDAGRLTALASACRDQERMRLRYVDRGDTETERIVEPHGLVHADARWYLAAYDLDREDWRTFRVDRIASTTTTGQRFALRSVPHGSVARYVARSVSTSAYSHQVRLILHAPHASMVTRVTPLSGQVEPLDEDRCVFTCGASSLETIGLWVCMLDVEFEVVEPPELLPHLRAAAARLTRAAKRSK